MAAPQTYGNDQYVNNQPQINILSQKFEQDPNTGNYEYSYEQDNGQAVSIASAWKTLENIQICSLAEGI